MLSTALASTYQALLRCCMGRGGEEHFHDDDNDDDDDDDDDGDDDNEHKTSPYNNRERRDEQEPVLTQRPGNQASTELKSVLLYFLICSLLRGPCSEPMPPIGPLVWRRRTILGRRHVGRSLLEAGLCLELSRTIPCSFLGPRGWEDRLRSCGSLPLLYQGHPKL